MNAFTSASGANGGRSRRAIRLSGDVQRGRRVTLTVDGELMEAFEGESLAAALLADGRRVLRYTARNNAPRGLFCGMGICFECVVRVGEGNLIRSCMTRVEEGMVVSTRDAS